MWDLDHELDQMLVEPDAPPVIEGELDVDEIHDAVWVEEE